MICDGIDLQQCASTLLQPVSVPAAQNPLGLNLANPNVSSAPGSAMSVETVQLVGSKFRLGRKLGGGSFGEIYLGGG